MNIFAPYLWAKGESIPISGGNDMLSLLGNNTIPSDNTSVIIVPGSSSPSNNQFFVPNILNISVGATVTWTNDDLISYKPFQVEQIHTVTSGNIEIGTIGIEFKSKFLAAGETFQHTFDTIGTFDYFCTIHPFMTGRIIVS